MPKITIAGHFDLPEHLAPGETITLTAKLLIHSASQDQIVAYGNSTPCSNWSIHSETLPGDIELETIALEATAERT